MYYRILLAPEAKYCEYKVEYSEWKEFYYAKVKYFVTAALAQNWINEQKKNKIGEVQ